MATFEEGCGWVFPKNGGALKRFIPKECPKESIVKMRMNRRRDAVGCLKKGVSQKSVLKVTLWLI